MTRLKPGAVVHGFCCGAFGRDSYDCRRVEAVGVDWVVTRDSRGIVELARDREAVEQDMDDRSYCWDGCTGPRSSGDEFDDASGPAAGLPAFDMRDYRIEVADGYTRVRYDPDWRAKIDAAAQARALGQQLRAGKPASFRRRVGRRPNDPQTRSGDEQMLLSEPAT